MRRSDDPIYVDGVSSSTHCQKRSRSPSGRGGLGDDHIVSEYVMSGTLLGRRFACEGTDIFSVRDGLVARKDSSIDWLTYQAQTGVAMTQRGARLLPVSQPLAM